MARPRVIISSDIGGNDKDDAQSLIHAMLYANDVDYRGIVVTRTDDGGQGGIGNGAAMAREIIEAYGRDLGNLREFDAAYPSAGSLRGTIREGATNPDWPGGVSDGARLIIEEARAASPNDPLYVLTWGPIHDAARALREAPDIVDSVRLIAIDGVGQDTAHQAAYRWIIDAVKTDPDYRDLWMIDAAETFRGIHVNKGGAKDPLQYLDWVKQNADGHGALGDLLYEKYTYNDAGRVTSKDGLKMGDTPSLLYLLDTADDDNPGAASWGGSFARSGIGPNMWTDKTEGSLRMGSYDGARTVYDERPAAVADFAERLDAAQGGEGRPSRPAPSEPEPEREPEALRSGAAGPQIGTGRTEVEDLRLAGYSVEGKSSASGGEVVETSGSGRAEGTFDGPAGQYRMTVGYINENDGAAEWQVLVNGRVQAEWSGEGGRNASETQDVSLRLSPGDRIALTGDRGGNEMARLDFIELRGTGGASDSGAGGGSGNDSGGGSGGGRPSAPPPPGPRGDGIGAGRTEIETLELDGYDAAARSGASGGGWVETDRQGTAAGSFAGQDGVYRAEVFFFNETDGASRFRVEVEGETVARWTGRGGQEAMERAVFAVELERGDLIELVGERDTGELARLDALVLTPLDLLG